MQIKTLLQQAAQQITAVSDSPQLDAEILLTHILNVDRAYLLTWPEKIINQKQLTRFETLLKRRQQGEPIAYIVGHKEFWSLDFIVNQHTLTPRPETEILIEVILDLLPDDQSLELADLGTGPGTIALSLAHERPQWTITATDISTKALAIAKTNAQRFGINNVQFRQSDWLDALDGESFHMIVSNPPYIAEQDPCLQSPPLSFEPKAALSAGRDGLQAIRNIVALSHQYLLPSGWLCLEHGFDQGPAVRLLLQQAGYQQIKTHQDYNGHDRVTLGEWLSS